MKYLFYNWKASIPDSLDQWVAGMVKAQEKVGKHDTFIITPPFSHLDALQKEASLQGLSYQRGAQDVSVFPQGAYTGDITAPLLKDRGVSYVLVGHAERRKLYGETSDIVKKKIDCLQQEGLVPVLCVGEEHQGDDITPHIKEAVSFVLGGVSFIAYEPQWAIGGSLGDGLLLVQEHITLFREKLDETGKDYILLYGGSVDGDSLSKLLCYTGIDGFLVGSASVDIIQSNIVYTSIYG